MMRSEVGGAGERGAARADEDRVQPQQQKKDRHVLEHFAYVAIGGQHLAVHAEVTIEGLTARAIGAPQPEPHPQLVGDHHVVPDDVADRDQKRAGVGACGDQGAGQGRAQLLGMATQLILLTLSTLLAFGFADGADARRSLRAR